MVQTVVFAGLMGWVALQGQKAVQDISTELQQEVTEQVQEHLKHEVAIPAALAELNLDAAQTGHVRLAPLNKAEVRNWEMHLWAQLRVFNSLDHLMLGTPQGELLGVSRTAAGTLQYIAVNAAQSEIWRYYSIDSKGDRQQLIKTLPSSDFRTQPWYQAAIQAKKPTWSPIYSGPDASLTISSVRPIYAENGQLQGVLSSALNLSQIDTFLNQLKVGHSGQVFIVDRDGYLIASSTAETPFQRGQGQQQQLQAIHSSDRLTQATAAYLAPNSADLHQLTVSQQKLVTLLDQPYLLRVTPLKESRGLDWLIVVVIPKADFTQRLETSTQATLLLAATIALIVASLIGLLISRWIIRPILRLSQAAQAYSEGQTPQKVAIDRRDELGVLTQAFNQMQAAIDRERRLFVGGPVVMFRWLSQIDWPVEYVSPNVKQFGYQAEDFINGRLCYAHIVHPDDVARIDAEIESYTTTGVNSFEQDYRLICANGEVRWVYDYTIVVRDEQGKVAYHEGYVLDITERKWAEESLARSEEKFSKAFLCSPDPISLSTLAEGRFIEVNKSFSRVTGYTNEEIVGHTVQEVNIWPRLEQRQQFIQKLQAEGSVYSLEMEFRDKAGNPIQALVSAEVITIHDRRCILSVSTVITERKRAEAELQSALERDRVLGEIALRIRESLDLNQIFNTAVEEVRFFLQADRVFIGCLDAQGQGRIEAESLNPSYASMKDWVVTDQVYLEKLQTFFQNHRVRIVNDTAEAENLAATAQDYEIYQIKATLAVPILVENELMGVLVVHQCSAPREWRSQEVEFLERLGTQVTIAVQQAQLFHQVQNLNTNLERQVEERTAELQQKMQELQSLYQRQDEFLHAVSHDLRTPILGSLMVLKNLQNYADNPVPVARRILERMMQSSDRQLTLINSLLETHSSEVRGIHLNCQMINLGELIPAIAEDVEPLLAQSQATLVNQLPSTIPLIAADPLQLRRVYENLISNALNHNPPGLQLTLAVTVEPEQLYCTVADNGVGMPAEQSDRLFERYMRGGQARSTGIGLGLYLCRQIVTAHGGKIGVTSNLGAGATFWFTLPR